MLRDFTHTKVAAWNPWHGCHKCSPGCQNCFVFEQDRQYGKDASTVSKVKSASSMPYCSSGTIVRLCFTSDFFIEEADEWRSTVWESIRQRDDCIFITTTKRPERILSCLPSWWGEGLDNFVLSVSIENQEFVDKRVPLLLSVPLKHRELFCSPLIGPLTLREYLSSNMIECINVGGEMASWSKVRPLDWKWVCALYKESIEFGVDFYFHQSGTKLMKGACNFGASTLVGQQQRAAELQRELVKLYGI